MTLTDLGTIANLLSAIAVLGTLIYLSRQVKQGNLLAKAHARQRMAFRLSVTPSPRSAGDRP